MTRAFFCRQRRGGIRSRATIWQQIGIFLLLGACVFMGGLSAQDSSVLDGQISRTRLAGVEFTLELPDSPEVVPALPDLTRSGVYELPGGMVLKAPLPLIFSGILLPPGKHSLAIEVSVRSAVHLLARPLGGGPAVRIPVTRGVLDRPGERILATLSAIEGLKKSQLLLRVQWGALLLGCQGERIPLVRQEQGDWILDTYRFPAQFSPPGHCVIGVIENRTGDEPLRRLVFTWKADESPRLRLEDPSRERIASARAELARSLGRSQIRLRRIKGGAEAAAGEEESLRRRIDQALQQRLALDEKLARLDHGDGVQVLLPSGAAGAGSAGLQVRLEQVDSAVILRVKSTRGTYQFLLAASGS